MPRSLSVLLAIGVMMISTLVAKADAIVDYTISGGLGAYGDAGSLSGTFSIDWTNDTLTAVSIVTSASTPWPSSTYGLAAQDFFSCPSNCGASDPNRLDEMHVESPDGFPYLDLFLLGNGAGLSGFIDMNNPSDDISGEIFEGINSPYQLPERLVTSLDI